MEKTFDQFRASLLYCNRCGRAMSVRERLLLVLPDGELYDYLCQGCGASVGSRTEKAPLNVALVKGEGLSKSPAPPGPPRRRKQK